jgi:hypothetical protein
MQDKSDVPTITVTCVYRKPKRGHIGDEVRRAGRMILYFRSAEQLYKELAVVVCEPKATVRLAPQNYQLMSERRILGFKPALRLECQGQDGQDETEQGAHYPLTSGDSFG